MEPHARNEAAKSASEHQLNIAMSYTRKYYFKALV